MEQIINLKNFQDEGKRIAFVNGNRSIDSKNLKKKMLSIKENGQLSPLVIVSGTKVINDNLTLIDAITGLDIPSSEADKYVAIVEGQHRFSAIRKLNEENSEKIDIFFIYALNQELSTQKLLSEMNSQSINWDGQDYIRGAYLCNPTSELLEFAKELTDNKNVPSGYPISTISKITTFSDKLTKTTLAKSMDEGLEALPSADIERGRKYLSIARSVGFTDKYLAKRYLIEWANDEFTKLGEIYLVFNKLQSLNKKAVDEISKIKGENSLVEIRNIIDNQ